MCYGGLRIIYDANEPHLIVFLVRPPHHGPVITVEDTGSQLRINNIKSSATDSLIESAKGSFDRGLYKSPVAANKFSAAVVFCESNGSVASHHSSSHFRRNNSRQVSF